MKKFFMALSCAVFSMSFVACNNEEDMPAPVSEPQNAIEASFPKGAEVKTLSVNVPEPARTRAGEEDPFKYWSAFQDGQGVMIRYAVYSKNNQLFYCSDDAAEQVKTYSGTFNLKVPVPADTKDCKIFIFADKLGKAGHDNYQGYRIDWENNYISMPAVIDEGVLKSLSKSAEAWYYYGDFNESTSNITLKRPMTFITLATDEFELPGVASEFGNKSMEVSYWFGKDDEDCSSRENGYAVTGWNFATQRVTFGKVGNTSMGQSILRDGAMNRQFTAGSRTLHPLMAAYYFAELDAMGNSNHKADKLNKIYFSVKVGDYERTFEKTNDQIGTPNVRLVFAPKHYSTGSGGIFTGEEGEIQCTLNQNWNTSILDNEGL